ncbi:MULTISPECIES: retropepsin-like aspartic protease [Clostridioides]|uniref:retropepsin-like aspartic protease n=1 Tax=unclassified Clostridioides TaxID=2635829 RepID=UPI00038CBA58|nr:aspartyl protease family protein [Clostridioides difficile CD160]MCC0642395.1 retropepsin-like domain-containing protein [Clostridioides sp. ES-S-0049-03]MCC0678428.1 retropepsin-like domain-containing protein [Clostridioides sp. ES-W-0018-02]MCC0682519.1 retropepsin-like domain-containing protein [Clostridioides sp. ES-S-0005-03]MCC0707247.1 retropepsin-like domain-containing protein [Clostridioides sp. ES-S-0190-01]MCC0713255.1 retropepsin-like domain-containing protein [Clostridioides sp
MKNFKYKNGLLYTDIEILIENKSILVKDMIIDTGASHTIISSSYLEESDIGFNDDDTIVKASGYGGTVQYSVRKLVNKVACGDITLENIKLDFGEIDPEEKVNGLLGLDFLINANLIIDLVDNLLIQK